MNTTLQKLYRLVFCRGGYGVHSPFVFELITKVIEEKRAYYCYESLRKIRWQLQQEERKIKIGNKEMSVKRALRQHCFSTSECELLFRLANYFQPAMIGVVGSGLGLVPLYLAAYSKTMQCVVFEPEQDIAQIAQNVIHKSVKASIDVIEKAFDTAHLPLAHPYDLIVWGKGIAEEFTVDVFEKILPHVAEQCVLVLSGINDSSKAKQTWQTICTHPRVTVTVDLCTLGIIYLHPNLNRKTYKSVVMPFHLSR